MAVRKSKAWIAFVVINALVTFFGLSYIFFPGRDVVKAGYKTEGVLALPAVVWGTYVVLSALAMLVVATTGLRRGERWARRAALYEFAFLAAVVVIEPDPVVPTIFAAILAVALWRSARTSKRGTAPGELAAPAKPA
ncbi:hypothetical protein HC031_15730 [Planosporangium thailandense]|uniref:Tryptophan-rich sensory protein n=1 Tax=Planosporangium thailandense TaxID=765197 RepID=A0ABX0XYP5_9ACTN|nr:hypothetical protein [Planosporangium thailandense]NJC71151.1 hypothetical protein [Planosporangium thailandense]